MPEDPNACPIELLKKSGKKNRENLKTKRAGPWAFLITIGIL
jgi:hypothetical protein